MSSPNKQTKQKILTKTFPSLVAELVRGLVLRNEIVDVEALRLRGRGVRLDFWLSGRRKREQKSENKKKLKFVFM